jgi:hypothetical protein
VRSIDYGRRQRRRRRRGGGGGGDENCRIREEMKILPVEIVKKGA